MEHALAVLADPMRRKVYDAVVGKARLVGRDEVADDLGIGRTLAAFHLDKLAEAELLEIAFERGPRGGRPAKLYRRSPTEVALSVPQRSYVDAAALLAEAVDRAGADLILQRIAQEHGHRAATKDMWLELRERGYEPGEDGDVIRLRNCPFHRLAEDFPPLVCGMNLALLTGLASGGRWPVEPRMRPEIGNCCVVLERR